MGFIYVIFTIVTVLTGCEPLLVLDPKGPQAKGKQVILCYRLDYVGYCNCVFAILVFVLIKYRASKQSADYEPPHIEGRYGLKPLYGVPVLIVHIFPLYLLKVTIMLRQHQKGTRIKAISCLCFILKLEMAF